MFSGYSRCEFCLAFVESLACFLVVFLWFFFPFELWVAFVWVPYGRHSCPQVGAVNGYVYEHWEVVPSHC